MSTLYRKYRPQSFTDVIGQNHVKITLQNEIAGNQIGHAYLFCGPRGLGKTTLARLFAKAVNCENRKDGESEPCNECRSCTGIVANSSVDIIEIDAASHTGVEHVREQIIATAQFQPARAKYKVFIIDEVHMLSTNAFNALLKTLEEPPAHALFILATTELHKLPATVVSRCQRFQFKKIPYDAMRRRLETICAAEGVSVAPAVLGRIINKSDGCLRDAESLLGQILSLNLKTIGADDVTLFLPTVTVPAVLDFLETIHSSASDRALRLLADLVSEGVSLDQFAYDVIEVLRVALVFQTTKNLEEAATDYDEVALERIKKIAQTLSPAELVRWIDAVLRRRLEIKSAPLPQLPLELLAIELSLSASPTSSIAETTAPAPPVFPKSSGAPEVKPKPLEPPASAPSEKSPTPSKLGTKSKSARGLTSTLKSALSSLAGSRSAPAPQTTLAEIVRRWTELVTRICEKNHALTFILSMAEPVAINGEGLELVVPYSLHRDKLLETKNKLFIEECLAAVFEEKIFLRCAVKTPPAPSQATDVELTSLALEFGGEVVN